jgi:peroxiredoxin
MNKQTWKKIGALSALVIAVLVNVAAKKEDAMGTMQEATLKIGDKAPDFKDLKGVDGKTHSLSDYASSKVLVVVFTCNHCPYAQAYENRLVTLQNDFGDKSVQFVAINPNDDKFVPEDSFNNMVKRAKDKSFSFPYLRDESQDVAHAYGATRTPHIFVFDEKRTLAYTGKIDDNWQNPDQVKKQYLREAIAALASGKRPPEAETYAIGCTIKWKA